MTSTELRDEIESILRAFAYRYCTARSFSREDEAMVWAGRKLFKLLNDLIAKERLIITHKLLEKE